jgi:hypothetical protein
MVQPFRMLHYFGFCALVLGGILLSHTTTAEAQATASDRQLAAGTFRLAVMGDLVSLEAQAASVVAILTAIGRQTGIAMHLSRQVDETITLHLDRVLLREALPQLARNMVMVAAHGADASPHGIAAVYVLAAGQAGVPHKVPEHPPSPGETGQKPAARPAPFQFTFDPSQHGKQP